MEAQGKGFAYLLAPKGTLIRAKPGHELRITEHELPKPPAPVQRMSLEEIKQKGRPTIGGEKK